MGGKENLGSQKHPEITTVMRVKKALGKNRWTSKERKKEEEGKELQPLDKIRKEDGRIIPKGPCHIYIYILILMHYFPLHTLPVHLKGVAGEISSRGCSWWMGFLDQAGSCCKPLWKKEKWPRGVCNQRGWRYSLCILYICYKLTPYTSLSEWMKMPSNYVAKWRATSKRARKNYTQCTPEGPAGSST